MFNRRGSAGILFILVTLFLDILGIGIIIPVLPGLIDEFVPGGISEAAPTFAALAATYALMQFLFAPLIGSLSDRFGRRRVILLALLVMGIDYLVLALAPSLAWLFIGRVIGGITGATITTGNAYIADISTPATRARNFGFIGIAFGLGFILGPAIGGLLGEFGLRVPFYAAAVVVLLNWLYGFLVLPESLPPEQRRPFELARANPLGGVMALRRFPIVAGLALAFVFFSLAQRGLEVVWVLYTEYRYGWSEGQNGLALALVGLMAAVVQGGLVRPAVQRFGERGSILIGLSITSVGFLLYGLAWQGWMLLVVIVLASLGGIAGPSIQGLVAGAVPANEQGSVQGSIASLLSLTAVVAPLIAGNLFGLFSGGNAPAEIPGMPFFAGALFALVALLLVRRALRRSPELSVETAPKAAD
jgi:DHA1 family tetracycline resistance protein-like MFS transporter